MTEQIKSAIDRIIDTRDYKYSHFSFTDDTGKAFDLAIRSLQAWGKVLQELEEMKCEYDCTTNEFQRGANAGANFIRNKAIEIINQHLAEIEE